MSHRTTTLVAALGLSAVLLGASPATAGTAHRIDPEKSTGRTVVDDCSLRTTCTPVAKRSTARTDAPTIVSARMAERGHSVRSAHLDRKIWAYGEDGTKRGVARHSIPVDW